MANLPRNHKTTEQVLERLANLGWIERHGWFTSGPRPTLSIRWTNHGKAMIANYLPILTEFGYFTAFEREVNQEFERAFRESDLRLNSRGIRRLASDTFYNLNTVESYWEFKCENATRRVRELEPVFKLLDQFIQRFGFCAEARRDVSRICKRRGLYLRPFRHCARFKQRKCDLI